MSSPEQCDHSKVYEVVHQISVCPNNDGPCDAWTHFTQHMIPTLLFCEACSSVFLPEEKPTPKKRSTT